MPQRATSLLVLPAAALLLSGCAAGGASAPAPSAAGPACAESARLADSAGLAVAFDSLYALAQSGRRPADLVLAPHDRKPALANTRQVERLLQTLYPPALREAGLGGTNEVALLIGADGAVRSVLLVRSSGKGELDRATIEVARGMRFRPARRGSCPVPFFAAVPISWAVERSGEGEP